MPSPARPLEYGLRSKRAPSSVTASPCPPTPFVPLGHFPLIGGIVLPPGGRFEIGSVGSANPGAVRKPQQNQILHTQGPVARKKTQASTPDFARRNHGSTNQEGVPRKKGSGESGPMDLGGAQRSRSPLAASPGAFWLLCRHGQSNSPPAGGETSLRNWEMLDGRRGHRPYKRKNKRVGETSRERRKTP